ncbi:MAG: type II secretion system F family protein [Candidatus Dormibacteria bacterium]
MSWPLLLAVMVAGLATVAAVYALQPPPPDRSALERVAAEVTAPPPQPPSSPAGSGDVPRGLRASLQALAGARFDRSRRGARLGERLAFASMRLRPLEWIVIVASTSALAALLAAWRFGSPAAALLGPLAGLTLSEALLRTRVSGRRRDFDRQLAPALLAISSGLRAGCTFLQAVELVSRNARAPMGPELRRLVRETQLGVPTNEALARMTVRNRSDDLKLVLTAVQIQTQVGGNLAEILDALELTIRERVRIKSEIKVITSQARISGHILMVLPFALGGLLSLVAPSYFLPMLHQRAGWIMLASGGFLLATGYLIIRRIVDIRV